MRLPSTWLQQGTCQRDTPGIMGLGARLMAISAPFLCGAPIGRVVAAQQRSSSMRLGEDLSIELVCPAAASKVILRIFQEQSFSDHQNMGFSRLSLPDRAPGQKFQKLSESTMTKEIISIPLPVEIAFKYIEEVLRAGGVFEEAAGGYDLPPERIFALAPDGSDSISLLEFCRGGVLPPLTKISDGQTSVQFVPTTAIVAAAELISAELASCDHPALWIHEPLLTEEELTAKNIPHETVGGIIYLRYADDLDAIRVAGSIRYSLLSWHFLAFVVDEASLPRSVADIYRAAKSIWVGAYDGESFLYLR